MTVQIENIDLSLAELLINNKKLRNESKTLDLTIESGQKRLKQIIAEMDKNNQIMKEATDATLKCKRDAYNFFHKIAKYLLS